MDQILKTILLSVGAMFISFIVFCVYDSLKGEDDGESP
jgi:hypothetical protein